MRSGRVCLGSLVLAVVLSVASASPEALAGPVAVRYTEGVTHGFLTLRSPAGDLLAEGDLLQVVRPEGVDSRLVFRFKDGSLHDETVVFGQSKVFTLLSYRLVQRGPTFPEEMEIAVDRDRERGRYKAKSRRAGGEADTATGEMELPPDVYNGMFITLLKNLPKGTAETVHVLAFMPKPMLIQVALTPGADTVATGERRVPVTHFVLKPKLGLLRGAAAALFGKTPPDYHCWIATAELPAFVAIDGPLYTGGPIWRIETMSPRRPTHPAARR
ncbi:MAG TPA: hypothetical protein VKA83_22400 [Methylomirabilota bacterium]|jgi:hypothetical protein|nr:hypothetical protein [Methylomirabilota bacterium]